MRYSVHSVLLFLISGSGLASTTACEQVRSAHGRARSTRGSEAVGGAGGASPDTPKWCAALGHELVISSGAKAAISDDDPRSALKDLVGAMCDPDDAARELMSGLEATRLKWMKLLDMTEADWPDAVVYATLGPGERMSGEVQLVASDGDPLKRAWSALDPIDQYVMLSTSVGASGALSLDHHYLADALGGKLTETGRFGYVRDCIRADRGPIDWAMCQGDIDRLDLAKVGAELRVNKRYSGGDKVRIRIAAAELKPALATHAGKVKKLLASDPGYGKLFAAAKAAREDWDGHAKANAALLELVASMDDARATNSRKAFAGCEDTTWKAWRAAVGTLPATAFEGMVEDRTHGRRFVDTAMAPIVGSPTTYLASVALVTCMTVGQERGTEPDVLVRFLGDALSRWPGFRGPRTATATALLTAGISLDDRDARLEYPKVDRPFGGFGASTSGGGAGMIAKVQQAGKMVTLEFKHQMVQQVQCAETRDTSRIVLIRPDGSPLYAWTCVRNETVTVDKSDRPQTVSARYAAGLKPGMFVVVTEDVAAAAWAKPGAPTPSIVFGVEGK